MTAIKILSLNTWKCDGEYSPRMDYMLSELQKINPDIIALQECFRSEESQTDTLKFLASHLRMEYSSVTGRSKKRLFKDKWVESYSDLGILSRYPITWTKSFDLPNTPEDPDRKIQLAEITLSPTFSFLLSNTHITHITNVQGLREAQLTAISFSIQNEITPFPFAILCGDFNTPIYSHEIQSFMENNNALDTYFEGGGLEPRISLVGQLRTGTYTAVDHIFLLPNPIFKINPRIGPTEMVLNIPQPNTGIFPSDHFGILTQLNF